MLSREDLNLFRSFKIWVDNYHGDADDRKNSTWLSNLVYGLESYAAEKDIWLFQDYGRDLPSNLKDPDFDGDYVDELTAANQQVSTRTRGHLQTLANRWDGRDKEDKRVLNVARNKNFVLSLRGLLIEEGAAIAGVEGVGWERLVEALNLLMPETHPVTDLIGEYRILVGARDQTTELVLRLNRRYGTNKYLDAKGVERGLPDSPVFQGLLRKANENLYVLMARNSSSLVLDMCRLTRLSPNGESVFELHDSEMMHLDIIIGPAFELIENTLTPIG